MELQNIHSSKIPRRNFQPNGPSKTPKASLNSDTLSSMQPIKPKTIQTAPKSQRTPIKKDEAFSFYDIPGIGLICSLIVDIGKGVIEFVFAEEMED